MTAALVAGRPATPAAAEPVAGDARATLAALLGIVAASPELTHRAGDLRAAHRRLVKIYAEDPRGGTSAAVLVSTLEAATGSRSFASAPRAQQLRALRTVLSEPPSRHATTPMPPREHLVSALHRSTTALTGAPHRPMMPRLTLGNGLVI